MCVRKRPIHRAELKALEFGVYTAAHLSVVAMHGALMHAHMRHLLMHHHVSTFDQLQKDLKERRQRERARERAVKRDSENCLSLAHTEVRAELLFLCGIHLLLADP
jgi:thiamine pyrophosphokinase